MTLRARKRRTEWIKAIPMVFSAIGVLVALFMGVFNWNRELSRAFREERLKAYTETLEIAGDFLNAEEIGEMETAYSKYRSKYFGRLPVVQSGKVADVGRIVLDRMRDAKDNLSDETMQAAEDAIFALQNQCKLEIFGAESLQTPEPSIQPPYEVRNTRRSFLSPRDRLHRSVTPLAEVFGQFKDISGRSGGFFTGGG